MRRPFFVIFAATTSLGALAYAALRELVARGGVGAAAALAGAGLLTAAGLGVLIRIVYLDGVADSGRSAQARELRRRL